MPPKAAWTSQVSGVNQQKGNPPEKKPSTKLVDSSNPEKYNNSKMAPERGASKGTNTNRSSAHATGPQQYGTSQDKSTPKTFANQALLKHVPGMQGLKGKIQSANTNLTNAVERSLSKTKAQNPRSSTASRNIGPVSIHHTGAQQLPPLPASTRPPNSDASLSLEQEFSTTASAFGTQASKIEIPEAATEDEQELTTLDWLKKTLKLLEKAQDPAEGPSHAEMYAELEDWSTFGPDEELAREMSKQYALRKGYGQYTDLTDPKLTATITLRLESLKSTGIDEIQVTWIKGKCIATISCQGANFYIEEPLQARENNILKGSLTIEGGVNNEPGWFLGNKFFHTSGVVQPAAYTPVKHTGQSDGWENLSVKYILDYNTLQMVVPKTEITLQQALTGKLDALASFDFIFTLKGSSRVNKGMGILSADYYFDGCNHADTPCKCTDVKLVFCKCSFPGNESKSAFKLADVKDKKLLPDAEAVQLLNLKGVVGSKHMSRDGKLGFRDTSLCGWQLAEFQN